MFEERKSSDSGIEEAMDLETEVEAGGEQWAAMQRKISMHYKLAESGCQVTDLETDLRDGVLLNKLLEVLSHKEPQYPSQSRRQSTQNVSTDFMIGPSDNLEQNLKQILSLLEHHSLSCQVDETSKRLMLEWMNATLQDRGISNPSLASLVDYCKPGLIQNHATLKPSNVDENISNVKCGEPVFSEPHIPVHLGIDVSNAGSGKLTAKCRGETSGEVEVKFTGKQDNPNGLTFTPTAEDVYTLSVYFDNTEVNGSPFSIDLHPVRPDPTKVTILEAPSGNLNTGDQIKFCFNTSKAGMGILTASCKGNKVGEVEVTVVKSSRQNYDVMFIPPEEDVYSISILWADSHIQGSPFSVNLNPTDKIDSSKCIVGIPSTAVYTLNKEISFEIDTEQAGKGSLTVTVISQEGRVHITPHIEPIPERPHVFKIRYTPTTTGTHTFDLLWANETIPSSPLSFEVIDANLVPLGIPIVIKMTAHCRKRHLKVYAIHHEKNTQHEMKVEKLDKSHFHLTFKPSDEGVYHVHMLHQDKEFPGSPLKVQCSKAIKATSKEDGHIEFVVDSLLAGLEDSDSGDMKHSSSMSSPIAPMSLPVSPESVTLTQVQSGNSSPEEQASPSVSQKGFSTHLNPTGNLHFKSGKVRGVVTGLNLENERFRVGMPYSFKLHCEDLGKEAPEITCKPLSGAEVNLTPTPGENSHRVEIVPKKPGRYELSVKFDGKHILGSPFNIQFSSHSDASKCVLEDNPPEGQKMSIGSTFAVNLDKPDASKCKIVSPLITTSLGSKRVSEPNSAVYTLNKEVSFKIDTAQAGKGRLNVTAISQEGVRMAPHIEPIPERPGVFNIKYTPTTPGTHTFDLLWANEAIPSSPLSFEVIDANLKPLGIPIVINMTANCRKRHLKVYAIHHEKNTQQEIKIIKLDKSHFHLCLKPKDEGLYHIHVLHQDKEFPGSPLKVQCSKAIKATSREDGHIGFVVDSLLAGLDDSDSGDMKHYTVRAAVGSTIAPMSVPVSPENVITQVRKDNFSHGGLATSTNVNWKGAPTGKTLFKWGKVKGAVTGLNLENEKFRVGMPYSFKLHCEDLGDGAPEITCKPPSGAEINLTPAPGENSHWVEIVPKKAGEHELSVKFDGKHILGSPFNVQFSSRSDASKCVLEDSPLKCQKMSTGAENIIFCVSSKGAGKGKLTAVVNSKTTKETLPVSITRPSKHHYHVEFTPSEGLDYTLTIKYDDFNIPGSPFKLVLGDATKCRMEGEGTIEAWLNEQNRFTVNAEDAGPGQLRVEVEGEGEIVDPDISMPADAVFEVAYQPSRPGIYCASVKWGNFDIPGSPFQIKCRKRILASEIYITNPSAGAYIGKPLNLRLIAKEREIDREEKFTVFVHSSQGEKFPGIVERSGNGSCVCTLDPPPTVGMYELHTLWTGEHIPGSPFDFEVTQQPEPSDFTVGAAQLEGGAVAVQVHGPKFAFRCGELKASVENSATTEQLPVTATQLSHEEYSIKIYQHKCGEYLLSILYDDNHIHGSPYRLIATDASLCYAKGKGLTTAQVGRENKFIVSTKNAGLGELKVDMEKDGEIMDVLISAASETRYEICYNPPILGSYKISVQWDNVHIPGSPFDVLCVDAAGYSVIKPPKRISLGKPIRFEVKVDHKPPAYEKLDVFARLKDKRTCKGEVRNGSDGNYICTVLPPELGKYQIHVRCNSLDIPGSPLKVKVMPAPVAENVRAYGEGLTDGVLGQERLFAVQVSSAGNGYLSFQVQGPKKGFHISMDRPDEEDLISARYTPIYAGDYTISLLWSGVHIPGSPFHISISSCDSYTPVSYSVSS